MKCVIERHTVKKAVYFISLLTQLQGNRPMQGALSSKGDYMGGIFDRWINIIPESIIFNEIILPNIVEGKKIEVITDFYDYNPQVVGVAPDVIGIRVDGNPIPFVLFNERWEPIENCPQIEVKTFKKSQKMVSLRNQGYDDKYLILALSDFNIDYLVPLLDKTFFSDEVYEELHMDDNVFIISNESKAISQPQKVDISKTSLGTVELLKITKSENFMEICNYCNARVSPEYFSVVEELSNRRITDKIPFPFYADEVKSGLYRFNSNWYAAQNNNKFIRDSKNILTLDIAIENAENIFVLSIHKYGMRIFATESCSICGTKLVKGQQYRVVFNILDRSSANGGEFFLNKSSIKYLKDFEKELKEEIREIIKNQERL